MGKVVYLEDVALASSPLGQGAIQANAWWRNHLHENENYLKGFRVGIKSAFKK